jgi:ubiquinone/menaquinone biosynthesis C-methylase UbiE
MGLTRFITLLFPLSCRIFSENKITKEKKMNDNGSPTPQLFWQTMTAFQNSAALKTAVELDVFTKVADGNKTAADIGEACGASERGIRILCDTLTVLGFLTKQNGEYALTEASNMFLNRKSQAFLGSAIEFIMSPAQRRGFDDLTLAVKNGGSSVTGEASLDPESPMWVTFARAMMPLMFPPAQKMAELANLDTGRNLKVLDIAAGHGIFGIMIAQKYPNVDIYALDWANVLTVATENAAKFGVSDRYHTISGSAFDAEFGDGYDLVLMTNFLHHFDPETCESLLRKVGKALNEGGKVLTLEFVPNDDRISPPPEALFSLIMLAATPSGDAYTFAQLKKMFENAGFSQNESVSLDPVPQHLIISSK